MNCFCHYGQRIKGGRTSLKVGSRLGNCGAVVSPEKDENSPLLHATVTMTATGFSLPGLSPDALYIKPSYNTMLFHGRGHDVGKHSKCHAGNLAKKFG
jgi:hypothetical protein